MNETNNKKQGIYVSLDALLDTRLGTLYELGPDIMLGAVENGYFKRRSEKFFNVDKEVFDEAYRSRNKLTLKQSGITKVIGFVNELVRSLNQQAIQTPLHTGPIVVLNIYPYKLEDSEVLTLTKAVAAATNQLCDVKTINLSEKQLTPEHCKQNYGIMFMYDYPLWLETQAENFSKLMCPEISLIVPGIYFKEEPTKDQLRELVNNYMHPLRAVEFVSAAFINLTFNDIELFCAEIPKS